MLLTADWVLPIAGRPLPDSGVVVHGTTISDVGPTHELRRRHPDLREYPFPGCVLTPGLVNAHTHLSLSALGGLLPSAPFPEWVQLLAGVMRELTADDLADSAALGAMRALQSGVTVVGDVAYGPEALATSVDIGLGGVFYWEVFGISEGELAEHLADSEYPATARSCGPRALCGLTPHSMYTSGPGLLKAVWDVARESDSPLMLHVAESSAESRLAVTGDGPLAGVAARLAYRFKVPRTSPVAYLERLGVLDGSLAVHCVQLAHGDAARLAAHTRGVVLCPTSNVFLHNGPPPVGELRAAGARVAIGTDSPASAPAAHVLGEAREIGALDAASSPEALLRMLTIDGAEALGVGELYGALRCGLQADVVAFTVGPTKDPVGALVADGGPQNVEAVMSGGIWRILERRPAFNAQAVEQAGERVAKKAAALVERNARD